MWQVICFLISLGIWLPFLFHSFILYNVILSYDIPLTDEKIFFFVVPIGMNVAALINSFTLVNYPLATRLKIQRGFLIMTMTISIIASVFMFIYIDNGLITGICIISSAFTSFIIFTVSDYSVRFSRQHFKLEDQIVVLFPVIMLQVHNCFGIPISVISIAGQPFETYLAFGSAATVIICSILIIISFYIKPEEEHVAKYLTFIELVKSIYKKPYLSSFIIITLAFTIVGLNLELSRIVAARLGLSQDDPLVEDISIDGYTRMIPISHGTMLAIGLINIGIAFYLHGNKSKFPLLYHINAHMFTVIFAIFTLISIVCVAVGNETTLRCLSFLITAIPVSFFGIAFKLISTLYDPTDATLVLSYTLCVGGLTSLSIVGMSSIYEDEYLVFIPTIGSLVLSIILLGINVYKLEWKAYPSHEPPPINDIKETEMVLDAPIIIQTTIP